MPKHKFSKMEYDLVILGAGCAGLACAIEAAERGGSVIVLEKMARPFGNILFAGGIIAAAGSRQQKTQGINEEVETFYSDLMKVSQQRGDPDLARVYAEKSGEAIDWLSDAVGVEWSPIIVRQHLLKSRGHQVKASRIPGGAQLFKNLLSTAAKCEIPIIYNSRALELLANSRLEISGVRVLMKGDSKDFLVKGGVVLATGGFHANRDLVKDYIGGWASKMPFRGSRANTGENIILTRPLKPKLVNMDQFHGGPIHGPTKANPSSMVNYGICVTPAGNRYVNEGWTYVRIGKETALKTSGNHAYIILDEESKKEPVVFERFERYAISKATIFEHEEISGLARILGINVEGLCKTVEKYNTAVLSKRVTDLDPPNSLERPRLIKIPKFYAIPFRGGMTATFGGPLINVKAQVINQADKIIPGLYAVGNAAGGLFYGDYIVGSQIGAAIVFGRIAAADACARAIKRDI